jgi:hypothetical protein
MEKKIVFEISLKEREQTAKAVGVEAVHEEDRLRIKDKDGQVVAQFAQFVQVQVQGWTSTNPPGSATPYAVSR